MGWKTVSLFLVLIYVTDKENPGPGHYRMKSDFDKNKYIASMDN
jgi:hypothetical protein